MCIESEVAPLERQMNADDEGDDAPQNKQQEHGMNNPDLYPGIGKLLPPHQITRSSLGFGNLYNGPARQDGRDNLSKSLNPSAEGRTPRSTQEPPSRKRRRGSSETEPSGKEESKHHHEKSYVHHEYHDYSGLSGGPVVLPPLPKKGRGGVSSMFPTVLHHMLDDAEKFGFAHIVSWRPHGRAFHVHKPEQFVKEVMTKYFRHTRLSSFQRQLSLYGFVRLARKGPDRGAYYHE